jgi:hypothetical protein
MQRTAFSVVIASVALFSTSVRADVTFEFEGQTWTAIGAKSPVSANHMFPGAAKACPSLKVKFEKVRPAANNGGKMTRDQRNRGDERWHVVCVR